MALMTFMNIFIMPNSTSILPNIEIKNYFGDKFGKLQILCRIRLPNSPFGFFAEFTTNQPSYQKLGDNYNRPSSTNIPTAYQPNYLKKQAYQPIYRG